MTRPGADFSLRKELYDRLQIDPPAAAAAVQTDTKLRRRLRNLAEDILDRHMQAGTTVISSEQERKLHDVLIILSDQSDPTSRRLKATALVHLGTDKRDRGILAGPTGAYQIYKNAGNLVSIDEEPRLRAQILTFDAACFEMSGFNDRALKLFANCEQAANAYQLDQLESMAQLRQATNLTKLGNTDAALIKLQESIGNPCADGNLDWDAVQKMKAAQYFIAVGRLDEALTDSEQMMNELSSHNSDILIVRARIQYAATLFSVNENDAALAALAQAEAVATDRSYGHQLTIARAMLDTHIGPGSSKMSTTPQSQKLFIPLSIRDTEPVENE
jgi:tetratricopeptide (TPR) repeat protein